MFKSDLFTDQILAHFTAKDAPLLNAAFALLPEDDDSYCRPTGKQVALVLLGLHVDLSTIVGALLSDPRLVGKLSERDITQRFGSHVMTLVKDLDWLNSLNVYFLEMAQQPEQYEILRRMLLAMTHDARAVIIKLAYRVQRLRGLPRESYEMRHFIANETLDIYAPIANRLGVSQLKWELEDLAFRYLQPQMYRKIAQSLAVNRAQRLASINNFTAHLQQYVQAEGINARIFGRPKHIYSIWKKMQKKQLPIAELYDLLAVRVIVEDVSTCYEILGLVHGHWQTVPKEFDDYVVNPKENGYQSLHTVILDPDGNRIEVQIRTQAMDEFAEYGIAAHWRYKEGGDHNAATEKSIAAIRQLLSKKEKHTYPAVTAPNQTTETDEITLASYKTSLFYDRVYVLTPKGKLIDLVKGATPLDFAYAIHTEVGHRCRGAKVNGRIVNLTYTLQSGEQVEVLTTKQAKPNRNWIDANLGYLKSPNSISKVKSWFKRQQSEQDCALGKAILEKEAQRLGLAALPLKNLCKAFDEPDPNKLLIAIGRGELNTRQIASKLAVPEFKSAPVKVEPKLLGDKATILVDGIANVLTSIAHCCNPLPGDAIRGYISHHSGITIHRSDCVNLLQHVEQHREQLVNVEWGSVSVTQLVPIIIQASQNDHLLHRVTLALNQAKVGIQNTHLKIKDDLSCILNLTVHIKNINQLSKVLTLCGDLPYVFDVKRKT
ncbi:MAG: RelA/SpoT family protein [Methylococcales bacterium]